MKIYMYTYGCIRGITYYRGFPGSKPRQHGREGEERTTMDYIFIYLSTQVLVSVFGGAADESEML